MTIEVLKNEWKKFFADLSLELARWDAFVETISPRFGRQTLVTKSPFAGVTMEFGPNNQISIVLVVGDAPNRQTHIVRNPLKVSYLKSEKLSAQLIAIEDFASATTFINLQEPLL